MKTKFSYVFIVLALLSIGRVARGATIIWTNTASGNWSAAANWSPNQTPGSSDTAVITNAGNYTVTLDVSTTVAGLVLGATSGSATQTFLINGQTFTLNGQATVSSNGQFNLNNGTLSGQCTLVGTLTWTGGTIGAGSTLTIATNGVLALAGVNGNQYDLFGILTNAGTIEMVNYLFLDGCNGGNGEVVNLPGAVMNLQAGAQILTACGGGPLVNEGTLEKTGGTDTSTIVPLFDNTGTVDVQTGTVSFNGGDTANSAGTFQTESGAMLDFGSSYTLNSGVEFSGAGTNLLTAGTLTVNNLVTLSNLMVLGGMLNVNGSVTCSNVDLAGGTLAGTGSIAGVLTWTGGTIGAGSTLTIATNGVLALAGVNGNQYDLFGILTNAGTIEMVNYLFLDGCNGGNGEVVNLPGAVMNLQAGAQILTACGGGPLVNEGTLEKTGGTDTSTIVPLFDNTGTVDVQTGTVSFNGGGNPGGIFQAAMNGAISFLSGSFAITSSPDFQGPGSIVFSGGTFTVSGGVIFTNTIMSGGTLNGVIAGVFNMMGGILGQATLVGTMNWYSGNINGGSTFTVATNGLFDIVADGSINVAGSNPARIVNQGIVVKSGGAGTTLINASLDNAGTVNAESGVIKINGGGYLAGDFQAAASAAIDFAGGSFVVINPPNFQGPGSINFVGGSVAPYPSLFVLTNGNSMIQIDPTTQTGMFSWIVDGTNQLYQKWFWLGEGTSPQISFDELGILYGVSSSPGNLMLHYLAQGVVATIAFTLTGGSNGSHTSVLTESVAVKNTTANPIALHLFAYSDFDMAGISDGDTVVFPAVNQIVQQGKGMMVNETVQSPIPSEWESSWYAITLDDLDDDSAVTLSDSMIPPDPGDQTFANQWDATLGSGQTFTINSADSIQPMLPTPLNVPLSIAPLQGNALISWPTAGTASFQLQTTSVLGPGAIWTAVTNLSSVIGIQYQVTVPHSRGSQFYRLQYISP